MGESATTKKHGLPTDVFLDQARVFTRRWGFLKSGLFHMVFLQALDLLGGVVVWKCDMVFYWDPGCFLPFHCAPIFGRGLHQISTTLGEPNGKPRVCFLNATHFCSRILEGSIIWIFRSSLLSHWNKNPSNRPKSSKSSPSLGDLGCFLFEVHLCFAWKSVFQKKVVPNDLCQVPY